MGTHTRRMVHCDFQWHLSSLTTQYSYSFNLKRFQGSSVTPLSCPLATKKKEKRNDIVISSLKNTAPAIELCIHKTPDRQNAAVYLRECPRASVASESAEGERFRETIDAPFGWKSHLEMTDSAIKPKRMPLKKKENRGREAHNVHGWQLTIQQCVCTQGSMHTEFGCRFQDNRRFSKSIRFAWHT